tara:strand:+ start:112 stop:369 length:258 start_codon:yes stop_codon:yes gene_type:complete
MMQFEEAAHAVRTGTFATSTEEQLMLYALYKIATVGRTPQSSRNAFDPLQTAKWDAWTAFGTQYTEQEATTVYPVLVGKLRDRHP